MKVIVAMDSYKGSLSAREACNAVTRGVCKALPQCDCIKIPVSDGGDGLLDTIPCDIETITVTGPLPKMKVNASIGFLGDTAIIESAQACGLHLLSSQQRNPMLTTSIGVGEMIIHALNHGCKRLIIGLGGSATNDLGTGMLTALGMRFEDLHGNVLAPCGGNINKIKHIYGNEIVSKLLNNKEITIACDVNNPLYGPSGAASIYAPQKGASPAMVRELEDGAISLSSLINNDLAQLPGAGAAGGLGYALSTVCNGKMQSGASIVLDLLNFDLQCCDAMLVITGEGSSDQQTLMGKIPTMIKERALKYGVKTLLLSGQIHDEKTLLDAGFYEVCRVSPASMPIDEAMLKDIATKNLEQTASRAITQIASSMLA